MDSRDPMAEQPFCCVIAPDGSLTPRAAWGFGALACLPMAISGFWAVSTGLWPMLPFAGLESLAVIFTLRHCLRRNAYREVIRVESGCIRIESGRRRPERTTVFEQAVARIWLDADAEPSRLWLVCRNRRLELGRDLRDVERRQLANRLKEVVGSRPTWPRAPSETDGVRVV